MIDSVHVVSTGGNIWVVTGRMAEDKWFVVNTLLGCIATLDHDYYEDDWDEWQLEDFDIELLMDEEKTDFLFSLLEYLVGEDVPTDLLREICRINPRKTFNGQ